MNPEFSKSLNITSTSTCPLRTVLCSCLIYGSFLRREKMANLSLDFLRPLFFLLPSPRTRCRWGAAVQLPPGRSSTLLSGQVHLFANMAEQSLSVLLKKFLIRSSSAFPWFYNCL